MADESERVLAVLGEHSEHDETRRVVNRQSQDTRRVVREESEDIKDSVRGGFGGTRRLIIALLIVVLVIVVLWLIWYFLLRPVEYVAIDPGNALHARPFEPENIQPHAREPLPQSVHDWRTAAWQRDDLFAQLKLGDLYGHDSSFYDPVEAVVWYYLALNNDQSILVDDDQASDAEEYLIEKASSNYANLFSMLTLEQREEARQRIIYILSHRGSEGFVLLGRLHRVRHDVLDARNDDCSDVTGQSVSWFARFSAKGKARCRPWEATGRSVIIPDDADALMYFDIAQSMGHPLADAYVNSQTNVVVRLTNGPQVADNALSRSHYWHPLFEFYPGQTRGGIFHTDESIDSLEDKQAYVQVNQIPQALVEKALWIVGVAKPPLAKCPGRCRPTKHFGCCELGTAISLFQELLGHVQTGVLTPGETVRLIRMAALAGDSDEQNELGIMYTRGLGVPPNYPRAHNWFERAAEQRNGEALYNLAILYKVGINGVPQDTDKAARLMTESAIAGFDPTKCQLLFLLNATRHEPQGHIEPTRRIP